ncbi:uncharacterized protein LACBIDRAFT_330566 [Laccaria bicolor S238N-H82]|uniref:Predicted protein n=1 Tax=Laccaria bicolor (strain S238N-H82 / ATCC MYA-4686) TaxID=486041 RepID=B0DLQ9_LACBS|nr:uncharacterized protein LACBIDRAFT_330566 [Laccaria bicolor S238N-H82]EDR04435.1 predicted protein [Laccaria bicolor S238N-H82]|eukprot:XP_001884954.1 predicted protein [Laccaria bicolor S238N-H82]
MDFCGTDTGDGCGRSFPNKSSPGLCAKCTKLASLTEGSPEYDQWKGFKQCESCGIAWKHLDTSKCGHCVREWCLTFLLSTHHNTVEVLRAARSHAMDARLRKQPVAQQLHTTAGLTAAKNSMAAMMENKVFITAQCRIKSASLKDQKNTDPTFGQWGKPWSQGEMAQFYAAPTSGTKKAAGTQPPLFMALELYIDQPKFMIRRRARLNHSTLRLPSTSVGTSVRKRSATTTEANDVPLYKRPSTRDAANLQLIVGGALESTFVRTNRTYVAIDTSVVQLKKAVTTCNAETGEVEIAWPDNLAACGGILGKEIFAHGATKNVYKLSIGSDLYVAKRFFDVGSGREVTAEENTANLENELIRLKMVGWFLHKFKALAKEHSVEFSSGIIVSECFLVHEIGTPSPASSLPSFEDDSAVWLVEPRRTKAVRKYSGTLVHPNRQDKLGQTLSAFAHFLYEYSRKELVLADIQGHLTASYPHIQD